MPKTAEHFAQALFDAEQSRQAIAPICRALGEQATVDDAYVIQDINTERSLNNRRRLAVLKTGKSLCLIQWQITHLQQPLCWVKIKYSSVI